MKKYLIFIYALLAIVVAFIINKRLQKRKYINLIKSKIPSINETALAKFDYPFLQMWGDAIELGLNVFTYNSKNYSTSTGRAVRY